MAADAVIIDDGGSTRIKQLKGTATGHMDDLLDKKKGHPDGDFSKIRVVALGANGTMVWEKEQQMKKSDSFKIISLNSQNVEGEMENNGKTIHLSLTVDPAANGIEPLVESKQHKQQRRYIVSNAGPIQKVEYTEADPADPNETQPLVLFDLTNTPSVYTMVILT